MAKDNDGVESAAEEQVAKPQQQMVQVQVKDEDALALYANFCRVTGSPEELIVDFGLNPQPVGIPRDPIVVKQRIIMNFYTAKRLLAALQMSVQRHEAVFGVLETDINKRLRVQQS
ncbi:MAG: DUF3467 domain-containing protein [Pirellulaceae bacterium]|jgi:hypothetical protein